MLLQSSIFDRAVFLQKPVRRMVVFLLALLLAALPVLEASQAQSRRGGLPLVRDAEIENLIKDYTTPVFRAAGLRQGTVEVFLLNVQQFNAFVAGTRMFINTGAIMQADTPNEIIGVFAHETGHIVGGHLTRLRDRIEKAQLLSVLAILAGAGAAASGVSGGQQAGAAIALGGQSAIQRNLLSYQRDEEVAADRTAVTLLNKIGMSGKGMLKTFERLGKNPLFSTAGLDPYALSHPLPRERIGILSKVVTSSPHYDKTDPPELQRRHNLARAKIAAYAGGHNLVRNVFRKNINGQAGTYGIAISHFLQGSPRRGLPLMNRLIKQDPKNPYFHEMRGEILLKSGKAAAAAKSFANALKLEGGKSGLLYVQLGHALLETNNSKNLDLAIKNLKLGISRDPYSSAGHGYMARAYARKGNQTLALAATAEQKYLEGRWKEAKQFAARAEPKLKRGSPQWIRIQDILSFQPEKN